MRGEQVQLLLASQGDHGAFEALIAPRRPRLLMLLVVALGDWHEAEDALQEALCRAYERLHQLRDPAALDAWLRGMALNAARDHLRASRARHNREGLPAGGALDLDLLAKAASQMSADADSDLDGCIRVIQAIAMLPPVQRRVGSLVWVAGLPSSQVARELGMSRTAVNACLHRARRALGSALHPSGTPRRDVHASMQSESDGVLLSGYRDHVDGLIRHWERVRPDLRVRWAEPHSKEAHVRLEWSLGEPLDRLPDPPSPAEALPLDRLADAAGFDLAPVEDRLLRFSHGARPFRFPEDARPHMITYNADILERVGLPLPSADWTWDDFFSYCRRCAGAGVSPHSPWTPNGMDCGIVAEQLGATADNLEPVREATDFVHRWRTEGLAHPEPKDRNALLSFFEGSTAFLVIQQGASVPQRFNLYGLRPFRWGVAPLPRFRRSDPHLGYWFHHMVGISAVAPDPVAAFRVVAALFTDGRLPAPDSLPAYRTPEIMAAWGTRDLPLGQRCLLAIDADLDPQGTPPWLCVLPGGGDALWSLAFGETTPEEGIEALRTAVAARAAGAALELRD